MTKILVWDLPTRVGHWLLVATFAIAWLSGESEAWRLVHVAAGYAMGALLLFRILWGFAGTRYARFASFLFSPGAAFGYLFGLLRGRPAHYTGHNPAGSYAIYGLILLGLFTIGSGWATYQELGGDAMEEAHDIAADLMLVLVILHVLGVVLGSVMHREKLILSMINGYKQGEAGQGIDSARAAWLLLMAALLAVAIWLAYNT
ncbi:MAG TPA: cytochrome b/b6 domain-containing protein [Gallionellaceae bacterium]